MNCYCPKCSASIQQTLAEIPAEGAFLKCPECGAGFSLQRESFARRALRKGRMISCAECGSQLGPEIYCPDCHAIYPDYHVTETSSAARKKLDKLLASLRGSGTKKGAHVSIRLEEKRGAAPSAAARGGRGPGKPLALAITVIVLLALIGGGGFYYYQDKTENEYAGKYVRAIYGIKTAGDHTVELSTKLVNDWRTTQTPTPPPLTSKDLRFLAGSKSELEILLKRIEEPPKKFASSKEAIKKYHESYLKLNTLLSTPPASLDSFAASAKKLENDFGKSGKELKAGLPPKIADRFNKSLDQYKNLQAL